MTSRNGQYSYDVISILEQDCCSSSYFAMGLLFVSTIVQLVFMNAKIVEEDLV